MERLEGKRAIVTGAASGIGQDITMRLVQEGARVALADIDDSAAAKIAAGLPGDSLIIGMDVAHAPDVELTVRRTTETWGGLDIMINNVGVGTAATVPETTEEEWERLLGINLKGTFSGRDSYNYVSIREVCTEVQDEWYRYQTALSHSQLLCFSRGAKRHPQWPPALPLQRMRRLVRRDPQHLDVPTSNTAREEIGWALLVVMRRGSLRAAEEITGHKYETTGRWLVLAAEHAEALTEVLVHDLELSELEIDEFWSFVQRRSGSSPQRTRRNGAIGGERPWRAC